MGMLIYTSQISSRIQYVFDFIFKDVLQCDYVITTDIDFFHAKAEAVKWCYGISLNGYPTLPAAQILYENHTEFQQLTPQVREDIVPLFSTEPIMDVDFDIFASAFYMISRYEEYLPCIKDNHGRYLPIQSIAYRENFLKTAMVNRYIFWLIRWMKKYFPDIALKVNKPKSIISIDVDHPFYSKDISLNKWILRSIKNMSLFTEKDKYDTFEEILASIEGLHSIFFILCPESPSEMDHLNKRDSENFKQLIQFIRSKSQIGIHPSYYSEDKNLISEEIKWLSDQHGRAIKSSRFHYLKWDIESSYLMLQKNEIQYDFSCAYSTVAGFRAGTSFPFYFFDLNRNKSTNLKIFSPCIMDSTFRYGSSVDFESNCRELIQEVKNYGGYFIPIFHNDILADEEWKTYFQFCIQEIKHELGK